MTKINIIYTNLLDNEEKLDIINNPNSFVLISHDSLGTLDDYDCLDEIKKLVNDTDNLELKIKEKIKSYKFKTLQNRNYLPIGSSILLNHQNLNLIYSPIMWVKQDISNTNNLYWSFLSSLSLILKYQLHKQNNQESNLIVLDRPLSPTSNQQRLRAFNNYESLKSNIDLFKNSLDLKDDPEIYFKECNINEQPPFLQNNEFRELSYN